MESIDTLQSKIDLIDEEITKKNQDEFLTQRKAIDFRKENWEDDMRAIEQEYRKRIESELTYIRPVIMQVLKQTDYTALKRVGEIINQAPQLKKYVWPTFEDLVADTQKGSDNYLTLWIALFVINDLESDPRDYIVLFNDFIKLCKSKKINSAPILQQLLPYASAVIKYGGHSVQSLMLSGIDQLSSVKKSKKA
jgi:hypothetical protein